MPSPACKLQGMGVPRWTDRSNGEWLSPNELVTGPRPTRPLAGSKRTSSRSSFSVQSFGVYIYFYRRVCQEMSTDLIKPIALAAYRTVHARNTS